MNACELRKFCEETTTNIPRKVPYYDKNVHKIVTVHHETEKTNTSEEIGAG